LATYLTSYLAHPNTYVTYADWAIIRSAAVHFTMKKGIVGLLLGQLQRLDLP